MKLDICISNRFIGAATAAGMWTALCKLALQTQVKSGSGRGTHAFHSSKGKKEAQPVCGQWLFSPLGELLRHPPLLLGKSEWNRKKV